MGGMMDRIRGFGWIVLAGVVVLGYAGCAGDRTEQAEQQAEEQPPADAPMEEPQIETAVDPVSGETVPEEGAPTAIFLDEVYHFASSGNLDRFRRDPETYATTTCAVTGERIAIRDAQYRTHHDGRYWYFATEEAMNQFKESPEEFATYRCPGCGMVQLRARPTVHTETIDGREMHFCCTHCRDAFLEQKEDQMMTVVPEGGEQPESP
ncbi:MAG: YHS domain-containing protein [Candidatus Eisenbacteria bacterium]|nr:YHS domain-containing protein [Candidatus Latescibacterota bacterium]MBD3302666.1 YHS domain-containing protein [Candidatus Eisenbacteria bacterium]